MAAPMTLENKKPHKITNLLLSAGVSYFDGQLWRVIESDGTLELTLEQSNFSPKILIVSSNYYKEGISHFPVEDSNELKRLLNLHYDKDELVLVQSVSEGKSTTNSWNFAGDVPNAWVKLPESLLIAKPCEVGNVFRIEASSGRDYFITQFEDVVFSAEAKGLISNFERFGVSIGLPLHNEIKLKQSDKIEVCLRGIQQLGSSKLLQIVRQNVSFDFTKIFLRLSISIASITFFYLMLTSSFLLIEKAALESKLSEMSSQTEQVLNTQSELDKKRAIYADLASFLGDKNNGAGLWIVMAPVFEQAKINNIGFQNGKVSIRGQTKSASKLLDIISQNANAHSVKFEAPTRRSRNMDIFSLSFILNPELIVPSIALPNSSEALSQPKGSIDDK